MRTLTLTLLSILYLLPAMSQRKCGTLELLQHKIKEQPGLLQTIQASDRQLRIGQQLRQEARLPAPPPVTVTIPVVVHILLENPALVTDAQVQTQLDVLNRDYAAANADLSKVPAAWQPLIGNAQIQFCLAQRTPSNEPTNGIERISTPPGTSYSIYDSNVKFYATGGADAWDAGKYLNIWVCPLQGDFLGVAAPPTAGYPLAEQGVTIHYRAFGTTGTASGVFNLGRTGTHEIGHYFGLKHIWGDDSGACTGDDDITDTPPQGNYTSGCPAFPITTDPCTKVFPGPMFMNYMDYSNDACMHLFTAGQINRVRYVLENITPSLMQSNGCVPVNLAANDASLRQVNSPGGKLCTPAIRPQVILRNKGNNPLNRVNIVYQLNNGAPSSYSWTGQLASLQEITVDLPAATVPVGNYRLKAWTTQPNSATDPVPENDTAYSLFRYDADAALPFSEGFENNTFPPSGWDQYNPDNSFTWERTRDAAKTGVASIVMRNLGYATNDAVDDIITPVIDGSATQDSVFLFFDVAAAVTTNPATTHNPWDTLHIMVTTDCREHVATIYKKWGANLITRQQATTTEFIPTAGEWRRDSVDITAAVRNRRFQVIFRNYSNYENNIYLDNIQIVTKPVNPYLREAGVLVTPNPTDNQVHVTFLNRPEDLLEVAIFNAGGQRIAAQSPTGIRQNNRMTFNLVNEPNGVYFVKLIYRNRANTIKILKVR